MPSARNRPYSRKLSPGRLVIGQTSETPYWNQLRPISSLPNCSKDRISTRHSRLPEMEAGERLDALESDMGQVTAQLMALNATLQTLIENQNSAPIPTAPTNDMTSETDATAGGGGTKIKPAPPSDFDGDVGKGAPFSIHANSIYVSLQIVFLTKYRKFIGLSRI